LKRLIFTFFALIAGSHLAYGQARLTATRTGDLQVGGGFVADYPDYTEHKFFGYAVYADLDFSEHFGVEGEFRQAHDTTEAIGGGGDVPQYQRNIEGGLRYHRSYRNDTFKPYAKIMYGYGVMEFPPYPLPASQLTPNGTAGYQFIAPGGGIDYVLAGISPHLVLRGDLEYQMWFAREDPGLGYDVNAGGKGGLPNGLTPIVYTGGIAWRFGTGQYIPHGNRRKGMY
jgi:hypothetical protein